MALPKIDLPIYELRLPSNDKIVKFRPFTVKEEKILLTAQEAKDSTQMMNAVNQIVNNCLIDFDAEDLAVFDLEYILINLRSKSVDNEIKFEIEDPDTKEKIKLSMEISNVKVLAWISSRLRTRCITLKTFQRKKLMISLRAFTVT